VNKLGNLIGKITASFKDSLAPSKPAISSQRTFGFSVRIAPSNPARNFFFSESYLSSSSSSSFFLPPPPPTGTGFFLFCF